jgi:anion transporter
MERNNLIVITLIFPVIIVISKPFGLDLNQSLLFASVVLTASWWATKAVDRNIASVVLLVIFLLLSNAPINIVFRFLFTATFYLVVFSTLIGEGIVRSNLASRISRKLLVNYGSTPKRLVLLSFVIGFVLILMIPQPFPRVIILSAIYLQYLKGQNISEKTLAAILFSIYIASTAASMILLNGDIFLNNAAIQFGGVNITWIDWARYMALPSIIVYILMFFLFLIIFKKEIGQEVIIHKEIYQDNHPLSNREKWAIVIIFFIMLLWMTEAFHGINAAWVSFFGVIAMFLTGLLIPKDLKKINIGLLIFITSAFSIGGVFNYTGIGQAIFRELMKHSPSQSSVLYYAFIILVVMMIHMFLGSAITTIAIAIPGLLSVNPGEANAIVLTLIAYITANIHFVLPFHNVTIMIGTGENYYPTSYVIKYGVAMTLFTYIIILFIKLPWWKLVGLL